MSDIYYKFRDEFFSDFELSNAGEDYIRAKKTLSNGNIFSVIYGDYAHCDSETYEISLLKDGHCIMSEAINKYQTYKGYMLNEVMGYVTLDEVKEIYKEIIKTNQ